MTERRIKGRRTGMDAGADLVWREPSIDRRKALPDRRRVASTPRETAASGEAPVTTEEARGWLLRVVIKDRDRFTHSFYRAGSEEQMLEDSCRGYGRAILDDFQNTVKLSEVAEWLRDFANRLAPAAPETEEK